MKKTRTKRNIVIECDNTTRRFELRGAATDYYVSCAQHSEGSQQCRFLNVLNDLLNGKNIARDHNGEHVYSKETYEYIANLFDIDISKL